MARTKYSNAAFSKDTPECFMRKADQHWEMAGCARQDGDATDAARHTKLAQEFTKKAREAS